MGRGPAEQVGKGGKGKGVRYFWIAVKKESVVGLRLSKKGREKVDPFVPKKKGGGGREEWTVTRKEKRRKPTSSRGQKVRGEEKKNDIPSAE